MEPRGIFVGGLVRLLADHLLLRYEASVFLWLARAERKSIAYAVVQADHHALQADIDLLGQRLAALGGVFPENLGALAQFCSFQSTRPLTEPAAALKRIRHLHHGLIENIGLLETVVPIEERRDDQELLSSLVARHSDMTLQLRAESLARLVS